MAQHDYNIANQSGADFRADLNNALSAIATVNSGATEPSTTFAHQLWVDTSSNVLKIRNAANNAWITTGVSITASNTFNGTLTGTFVGNATTATTLETARTINGVSFDGSANISFDTDSVSEGSSNLYFTNERVDDQVNTLLQAGTGIQLTYDDTAGTLTIANTNDADITGVVAGNGLTGGGTAGTVTLNVAVDDSSIEIDSDALQVKASGITNAMLAGSITNAKLSNSSITINSNSLSLGGTLTLDTDDIGEGSSNLYYTQARFDSAFAAKSTSDLSEGTNLYYTDARFDTRLGTKDTGDLSEGTNLYYTDARARASISEDSTQLSYNSTTGVLSFTQGDTDTVSEGSSNLYYTSARANADFDTRLATKSTTNLSEGTNLYYTTARFDSAFTGKDTDDLSEGSTNVYYTDARANSAIDARVTKSFVDALNVQAASVDANSVALGTDTTGNYVATITGTANKVSVSGSGSESADITLSLPDDVQIASDLTVAGNLTVNGTLTSLDTTNLDIEDNLFQLNAGLTGSPVNDSGMLINRGSSDNGIFMWDESTDKFTLGLTTADGSATGNITLSSLGTLVANIEGDVTGSITGTVSSISNHSTSDLSEGTNLYYTDARFDTRLGTKDTDDVSEGSSNLYYTTTRFDSAFSGKSTSDLSEGSNLYYTSARANSDFDTRIATKDTSDLAEGSNLYYTDARVQAVSINNVVEDTTPQLGGNLDLNSSDITGTGDINITGTVNGLTLAAGSIATSTSQNFALNTPNSLRINIDSNNSATDQIFVIGHNQTSVDNNNSLLTVLESGNVGIGMSPTYRLDVTNNSTGIQGRFASSSSSGTSLSFQNSATNGRNYRIGSNFVTGAGEFAIYDDTASAERMRIDGSGNVGINTSPSAKLDVSVSGSGTQTALILNNSHGYGSGVGTAAAALQFRRDSGGGGESTPTAQIHSSNESETTSNPSNLVFSTKNNSGTLTEAMRIDSSGRVGIGCSPNASADLHIADTSDTRIWVEATSGDTAELYAGTGVSLFNRSNSFLNFGTNNTERMRIDSSGNVGIGVTPSAWSGTFKALQVSSSALYNNNDNDTFLGANYFYDGSNKYINSSHATAYGQVDGQHIWYTAPSGTAGNAVTFSERMRIDSSGNCGIGETAPLGKLHVKSADSGASVNTNGNELVLENSGSAGISILSGTTGDGNIFFGDSGGSVQGRLSYSHNGDYLSIASTGASIFYNGGSERIRIDSSGVLLVGKTAKDNLATTGFEIHGSGGLQQTRDAAFVAAFNRLTTDGDILEFHQNTVKRGSISISGANTSYNTTSDARLKDVTGEARGLEIVNKLNPVSYNWKHDGKADEGLIAQEVMDIVPNAVSGSEEEMYQMDYSKLVVHLVKGMKEQQTQIEALQSEINLLKGE